MQYYNWTKIALSKGFDDEKIMFLTLLQKYSSKNKMVHAEFPDIANSTVKARMAKLGIKKECKQSLSKLALQLGYASKEDLVSSLIDEHSSVRKVAKLLNVSKVRVRQICKQYKIEYRPKNTTIGNSIKTFSDDIYFGWEPPCKDCPHQFEDKLDKSKKCWTCGKPQYWHDHKYPDALQYFFSENSV